MRAAALTIHAEDTLILDQKVLFETGRADLATGPAIGTQASRHPFEGRKASQPSQQGAQRTEIAAPVAGLETFQCNDSQEYDAREQRQWIDRVPERKQAVVDQVIGRCQEIAAFADQAVESDPPLPCRQPHQGVEEKRQSPQQDCDRIEKSAQVEVEQGS